MTAQVTLLQLEQFSAAAYDKGAATGNGTYFNGKNAPAGWTLIQTSPQNGDGYVGLAWKNSAGEIVIANRGTVPTNFHNLLSDATLAAHKIPSAAVDAAAFALQVAKANRNSTITETGHSLGGYEAQFALVNLLKLNAFNIAGSAVTFQAPGLPSGYTTSPGSYPVLNLYNQGDVIHDVGTSLGQSNSIVAGPSTTQEMAFAAAGFGVGLLTGGLASTWLAAVALGYEYFQAHIIKTTLDYLNVGGAGSSIGGGTAQTFISQHPASDSNPLIAVNANGSVSQTNGVGDSVTLQALQNNTMSGTVSLGGAGGLTTVSNPAGISAELVADGSATFSADQSAQAINSLAGASALYGEIGPASGNGNGATIGSAPTGGAQGLPGQAFVPGATSNGRFEFNVPGRSQIAQETIVGGSGQGTLWVNGPSIYAQLAGGSPVPGSPGSWADSNGTKYVFTGSPNSPLGTLTITSGLLGSNLADSITIQDFNLSSANGLTGYMGIFLPGTLSLNAAANAGVSGPTPIFVEGSNQSYTLSVDAPSSTAQTISVALSGAAASDFQVFVGNSAVPQNSDGSYNILLAAGQTNVAFTLEDVTAANGSSDIATGATLQLTASLPNLANPSGPAIQTTPLTFSYIPTAPDTSTAPNPTNVITGKYDTLTGNTVYTGDGGNDYIAAGAGPNYIDATNSISDSIVGGSGANTIYGGSGNDVTSLVGAQDYVSLGGGFNTVYGGTGKDTIYSNNATAIIIANNGSDVIIAGDGTNEIYAGAKTSLANAIAAASTATATGLKGDLIAVGDGNNTIVGSNGNDLITSDDSFQNGTGGNMAIICNIPKESRSMRTGVSLNRDCSFSTTAVNCSVGVSGRNSYVRGSKNSCIPQISIAKLRMFQTIGLFIMQIIPMTLCSALSVEREVTLLANQATTPISLDRTADGGYVVVLDTYPPALIKLDALGKTQWSFEELATNKTDIKFRVATPDKNGGVLVCAARKGGAGNLEDLPSVVIRLNNQGHESARLDSSSTVMEGGSFYGVSGCVPWGDGYAIVANEKRPKDEPDDYGEMSGWRFRNVILRLRSDLSVVWRKPIDVHANPLATTAGPRVLRNGDLIVPGMDRIFRLDKDGSVKARADLPPCKWLRTDSDDDRLRLACARLQPPTASTIIEYDESLKIVSKIPLGDEDVGLPTVCELANGTFALLGNDGPNGPFVQTYSEHGKALNKYRFPKHTTEGAVIDGLPQESSGLVAARYIDQHEHFVSIVTWLKTK